MNRNRFLLLLSLGVLAVIALTVFVLLRPDKPLTKVDDGIASKADQLFTDNSATFTPGSIGGNAYQNQADLPQSSTKVSDSLQPSAKVGSTLNTNPSQQQTVIAAPVPDQNSAAKKSYVQAVASVSAELDLINNRDSIQNQFSGATQQSFINMKAKSDRVKENIAKVPVPLGLEVIANDYVLVYADFSEYLNAVIGSYSSSSNEEAQQKIDAAASIYLRFFSDLRRLTQEISS